jgi:hypothetical protein
MNQSGTSRLLKTLGALAAGGLVSTTASAQIMIAPTTTAFTDISVTGTNIGAASDDSELNITMAQLTAAGFAGNQLLPLATIRVGNNGAILWNAATGDVGYINSTMFPTMVGANLATTGNGGAQAGVSFLCPLWDDNTPAAGQGANAQDWQVIGGNLIIQWSNQAHFNATTGSIQYEAIIYGGATIASGAPLVDFVYNDTLYAANQYQNDGGSATIGYKNWGTVAAANDVQYGLGGGTDTLADPVFGGTNMQPKVGGYTANNDPTLPHALRISGMGSGGGFTSFCAGDGSGTACPCGNDAPAGSGVGCLNSLGNGAALAASGNASISADTLSLDGSGMPNSSALYFQGTMRVAAGAGAAFGDGLRCAGGTVIRLGTKTNVNGSSSYPSGSTPISVKGADAAGNVRQYQCWYRNAAAFCTPSTFNLTNGVEVTWAP